MTLSISVEIIFYFLNRFRINIHQEDTAGSSYLQMLKNSRSSPIMVTIRESFFNDGDYPILNFQLPRQPTGPLNNVWETRFHLKLIRHIIIKTWQFYSSSRNTTKKILIFRTFPHPKHFNLPNLKINKINPYVKYYKN